jgi:hypothetical protein
MKKLLLLLILSFFSIQGYAASCPDGSDPVKSVSADGSYFEYKCASDIQVSSSANKELQNLSCQSIANYTNFANRSKNEIPDFFGIGIQAWNPRFVNHPTSKDTIKEGIALGGNLNHFHFNVRLEPDGTMNREESLNGQGFILTDKEVISMFRQMKMTGKAINFKLGFYAPEFKEITGYYEDYFGMTSYRPNNVDLFFEEWSKQLLHYAKIAEEENVDILEIAYEFHDHLTNNYESKWLKIIKDVRSIYTGKLSAHFLRPKNGINSVLLKHVDIIQASLFTKSTNKRDPSIKELQMGWFSNAYGKNLIADICYLAKKSNKKVLLGDMAFLSLDGANTNWNGFGDILRPYKVDEKEQADQIEAIFSIVSAYPEFISGVTLLTWFPFDTSIPTKFNSWSDEIGEFGRSFKGKEGEKTVKSWFSTWESKSE